MGLVSLLVLLRDSGQFSEMRASCEAKSGRYRQRAIIVRAESLLKLMFVELS